MLLRVLSKLSYRKMPWKNGQGMTTEICRYPSDESSFDWRISSATVSQSGPFSLFPEYERSIAVLNDSLSLKISSSQEAYTNNEVVIDYRSQPYKFSGAHHTVAELASPDKRVLDFNVFTKNGLFDQDVMRIVSKTHLSETKEKCVSLTDNDTLVVFCSLGTALISAEASSGVTKCSINEGNSCILSHFTGNAFCTLSSDIDGATDSFLVVLRRRQSSK